MWTAPSRCSRLRRPRRWRPPRPRRTRRTGRVRPTVLRSCGPTSCTPTTSPRRAISILRRTPPCSPTRSTSIPSWSPASAGRVRANCPRAWRSTCASARTASGPTGTAMSPVPPVVMTAPASPAPRSSSPAAPMRSRPASPAVTPRCPPTSGSFSFQASRPVRRSSTSPISRRLRPVPPPWPPTSTPVRDTPRLPPAACRRTTRPTVRGPRDRPSCRRGDGPERSRPLRLRRARRWRSRAVPSGARILRT